jgi:16S rRNA (adenine1518-N6/adenine1519-N6)-dimethyltransferase
MDRKKRYKFGQNYLKDPLIINSILSAIHPIGSKVLEIGPGNGALTSGLAKNHKLTCIEIDPENVEYLSKSLASQSGDYSS